MLERVLSRAPADIAVSTFSLANDGVDDLRVLRFAPERLEEYSPDLRLKGTVVRRVIEGSRFLTMIDQRTSAVQFKIANAGGAAVRATTGCVDELLSMCEATGPRVVMVVLPQRSEVAGAGARARVAGAMAASARREVARIADRHGVLSIDATEALRAVQAHEGAYLPNDPHWTPAGHAAVAREILGALPQEWLIDEPDDARTPIPPSHTAAPSE
jgi:hypothetical protein